MIPAPADFEVIDRPIDLLQVVPDADALQGSARAFKELVGRWLGRSGDGAALAAARPRPGG